MQRNGNSYEDRPRDPTPGEEASDEDTAELPVLALEGPEDDAEPELVATPQAREEAGDPPDETSGEARASSWVSGMEAEIQWLQERWRTLDRELRRSEERARKLSNESGEKDRAIADLNNEIARQLRNFEDLNARLAERETSVSSLEAEKAKQDERLAEKSEELNQARGQAAVLEDRLQAALKEREELSRSVGEEKARIVEIGARRDAIEATNQRLATRVQDLEIYIEGRKDKWAALNSDLESRKARVGELEAAVTAGAKRLDERDAKVESLEQRVVELERLHSEAEGRLKERESSYRETQTRLTEQAAEIGGLRATANDQDSGARLASEAADEHRKEIDALGQTLAEKDETIKTLENELAGAQGLNEHLDGRSAEERKRIDDLQRELSELGAQRDRMAEEIVQAEDRIATLDRKLEAAEAALAELRDESAGQQAKIADIEEDLAKRSEVIRAFDRHAKRLSALKQNLHSLSEDPDDAESIDAETTRLAPPGPDEDRDDATDAGDMDELQPFQRMIVPLDADPSVEGAEYSLSKPVVTIGRAKTSDIRILDAVVSRMHARLTTDKDITIIEDLGSKNGVLVNSRPVDRAVLHHGDVISLGANHDFRYVEIGHATH
jgi:chromosome segregation ATPase